MLRRQFLFTSMGVAGHCAAPAKADVAAAPAPEYSDKFEQAFAPGFSWPDGDPPVNVPFKVLDAGKLTVSSGAIVACDPFVGLDDSPAFLQTVPTGLFPVRLAFPMVHGELGGRVAFARIDFNSEPIKDWRMALVAGNDPVALKPGYIFGYGVDAGTGCFSDKAALTAFLDAVKTRRVKENYYEDWITAGEDEGRKRGMNFFLEVSGGPGNIIMFESGWGDGYYASYFGYDAQGRVAALLTDFTVIDWSLKPIP